METTRRSIPTASRIGFSATTICIVEQLGLATIPWCASSASGLTSGITSGTPSSIRQRDELSIAIAPASAKRGAHSPLTPDPAEKSATSKPAIDSSLSGWTTSSLLAEVDLAPGGALGGEGDHLASRAASARA